MREIQCKELNRDDGVLCVVVRATGSMISTLGSYMWQTHPEVPHFDEDEFTWLHGLIAKSIGDGVEETSVVEALSKHVLDDGSGLGDAMLDLLGAEELRVLDVALDLLLLMPLLLPAVLGRLGASIRTVWIVTL